MNKFGYAISRIRQIDYDSNDRSAGDYISANEPSFRACIECGGCSATCTSGSFTRFSLREINILIKRGETRLVKDELRKCMLCGKCTLVCPRGVNTRNIIVLAKEALSNSAVYAV